MSGPRLDSPVPRPELCRRIESMARQSKEWDEIGPWSRGEQMAVCLVLDRHDWLQSMGYTMLEAIDRMRSGEGADDWLAACLLVQKLWDADV